MNIPILLTFFRMLAVPIVMITFYLPWQWSHAVAAGVFALAAATDWLDGHLARNWKQITRFGTFLDPVADKLIVSVALVLVVGETEIAFLAIPAAIIVGREIMISALREWMAELGKRTSVAVSRIGKLKTTLQLLALILLLFYSPHRSPPFILLTGVCSLYVAAALTLWSMVMYLHAAWPDLTLSGEKE